MNNGEQFFDADDGVRSHPIVSFKRKKSELERRRDTLLVVARKMLVQRRKYLTSHKKREKRKALREYGRLIQVYQTVEQLPLSVYRR